MTSDLKDGALVTDKLLEQFGASCLRHVEQLSPHSFRATLAGGEVVLAVVDGNGAVTILTPEEVC